jgi:superoxide dismutase, Fe-Mn family
MAFRLPDLPYPRDALEPHLSRETLELHHDKHHRTYVETLNQLIEGTAEARASLEDLVRKSDGKVFDNAAQHYNHSFYWQCMKPNGGGRPGGKLARVIEKSFGSFADFKEKFSEAAVGQFGSGWAWVVKTDAGLAVMTTSNADNPLVHGRIAILTCDVWEHAYYVDYKNERPKYVEAWWNLVDWDFAERNL